jgi:hypothetical protein
MPRRHPGSVPSGERSPGVCATAQIKALPATSLQLIAVFLFFCQEEIMFALGFLIGMIFMGLIYSQAKITWSPARK